MISIVEYTGLRCYDSCLAQIIKQEGGHPENYFCRIWKLPWKEKGLMGERLHFETEMKDLLVRYADLESSIGDTDVLSFKFEKGLYTILEVDTWEYPFHRLYHKEHTNHFCLYAGRKKEKVVLIDPMLSTTEFQISLEQLKVALLSVEQISIKNVENLQGRILIREMEEFGASNIKLEQCEKILNYFSTQLDLKQEYLGVREGRYEVPLYRSLWSIMFSRRLYAMLLDRLFIGKEIHDAMENLFEEWKTLRAMLLGLYLRNQSLDSKVINQMKKILEKEIWVSEWNSEVLKKQ